MLKCFYKKRNEGKTFFNKNIKIRSIAYGDKISENYLDWLNFYKHNWENVDNCFWIFKRGDITGNCHRGNTAVSKFSHDIPYKEKEVDCYSNPLFLFNHCYSINQEGFLLIDNNRSIHIGDVKSWSIMVLKEDSIPNIVALIDIGIKGKLQLSLFNITNDGVQASQVPSVLIDSNSGIDYFIECFGNHVFLVHDSSLSYYYYNNIQNVFEEVCIGENEENRNEYTSDVCTDVVADYCGNIYWGAGNALFCFKIGSPNFVTKIDNLDNFNIFHILTFDKKLFVTYGNVANGVYQTASYEKGENGFIKKVFLSDGERLIFIDKIDGRYKYIKFSNKVVQLVGQNNTVLDVLNYTKQLNEDSFFLVNATLIENLVSFGCDAKRNYYLIKEKR